MASYWERWRLRPPASRLFTQPFIQAQIKENLKAPRHWPLWGEFTGDRWIPRTKGQWRGKCFHLMASSWSKTACLPCTVALVNAYVTRHCVLHIVCVRVCVYVCVCVRVKSDMSRMHSLKINKCTQPIMMTQSRRNVFRVTGSFWGEPSDHRWFRLAKGQ